MAGDEGDGCHAARLSRYEKLLAKGVPEQRLKRLYTMTKTERQIDKQAGRQIIAITYKYQTLPYKIPIIKVNTAIITRKLYNVNTEE